MEVCHSIHGWAWTSCPICFLLLALHFCKLVIFKCVYVCVCVCVCYTPLRNWCGYGPSPSKNTCMLKHSILHRSSSVPKVRAPSSGWSLFSSPPLLQVHSPGILSEAGASPYHTINIIIIYSNYKIYIAFFFFLRWGIVMLPRLAMSSWAQEILLPQPPEYLGLRHAAVQHFLMHQLILSFQ
jgi:hypothetical protein